MRASCLDHTCRLQIADKAGVQLVADLLSAYPLLTTKYQDALRWSRCVQLFCSGDHLSLAGIEEMSLHKSAMNSCRPKSLLCGLAVHGSVGPHFADWLCGFVAGEASFFMEKK
eukprot:3667183-Amphidinium_carterae.1